MDGEQRIADYVRDRSSAMGRTSGRLSRAYCFQMSDGRPPLSYPPTAASAWSRS